MLDVIGILLVIIGFISIGIFISYVFIKNEFGSGKYNKPHDEK